MSMALLDVKITDVFGEAYPDEVEMGNKQRRAAANTPQGQVPQVMFEPLTARRAICHALTMNLNGEQDMAPEAKFRRGELAMKFVEDKTPELTVDEVAMVRELTARIYAPLIVYHVWKAIGD